MDRLQARVKSVRAFRAMQTELNFGDSDDGAGYTKWLAGRRMAADQLARRINLPLGHQVEIWLYGGVRLRGQLRLEEEVLFVEEENVRHLALKVDRVAFKYGEMEACVRLD